MPPISEPIMNDNAAVFRHFWYLVDGRPRQAPGNGFVSDLKTLWGVDEIRECNPIRIQEYMKGKENL